MKAKELLRCAAVFAFGGFGLYNLVYSVRVLFREASEGNWGWALVTLLLMGLAAGVPLSLSYFAFRRRYYPLAIVVSAVATLCVWGVLMSLPAWLGIQEFLVRQEREMPWLIIVSLPFALLWLFGPCYVAARFLLCCLRLAERYRSRTVR